MPRDDLTIVRHDDWSILHALARRVLCADGSSFRHPCQDLRSEVERSAHRLSRYVEAGELVIRIRVPRSRAATDAETMVSLEFDDGLEPIVVPWSELDLALVPVRRSR